MRGAVGPPTSRCSCVWRFTGILRMPRVAPPSCADDAHGNGTKSRPPWSLHGALRAACTARRLSQQYGGSFTHEDQSHEEEIRAEEPARPCAATQGPAGHSDRPESGGDQRHHRSHERHPADVFALYLKTKNFHWHMS